MPFKDPEVAKAYDRKRAKSPERKQAIKDYRAKNKDKVREWKRLQDKRYRERYPERMKELAQKQRAQKAEGVKRYGRIDTKLISNYYSRICGICSLPIESSFEVDHIIPLSRNGSHTLENLQITHPVCNRTKKGRLQKEMALDIVILKELIND